MDPNTALIVIDVQKAIDEPKWSQYGERNNREAESNMTCLLQTWRSRKLPIYHIRHDSLEPYSTYRPGQPGNDFKPEVTPELGELVIAKHTNNAFIGTQLDTLLRCEGHMKLVICGVITNNSVEASVRMAGNLGFETYLVEDACFTFPRLDWSGRLRTAEEVHAMSLANMHGEYCTVLTTRQTLLSFA